MKLYPVKTFIICFLSFFSLLLGAVDLSAKSNFSKKRIALTKLQDKKLDNSISALRKKFIAAETALKKKQIKKFKKLLAQLKDYPLYPFLSYQYLRKNISHKNEQMILAFIKTAEKTPYAERIRKKWLDYNAKRGNWKSYLTAYTPQSSVSRQCDYLHALLKTGQKQRAFDQVKPIWLSGRSQPKKCDVIFNAWQTEGHITTELRWQRIKLAMNKGRISLAKYLAKPLDKENKQFLDEWIKLYRKPQGLPKSRNPTTAV